MKLFKYLTLASITIGLITAYYPTEVKAQGLDYRNRNYALNDITDNYFKVLHTGINQIKHHQTTYKKEWLALNRVVNNNLRKVSCGGNPYTDPNAIYLSVAYEEELADAVFYARHPELAGRSIRKGEERLINEWNSIYNQFKMVYRPDAC